MQVIRAKTYVGFCGGVKRAWNRAVKAAGTADGTVFISGKLIHNTPAMQELGGLGVRELNDEDVAQGDLTGKTILMRAHGEGPLAFEHARSLGLNVIDATCPIVTAVQKIAVQLENEGYQVIVFGHRSHPEARATVAYTKHGMIVESAEEAKSLRSLREACINRADDDVAGGLLGSGGGLENQSRSLRRPWSDLRLDAARSGRGG